MKYYTGILRVFGFVMIILPTWIMIVPGGLLIFLLIGLVAAVPLTIWQCWKSAELVVHYRKCVVLNECRLKDDLWHRRLEQVAWKLYVKYGLTGLILGNYLHTSFDLSIRIWWQLIVVDIRNYSRYMLFLEQA